jgi:MYXO-CTERM domain-containing protein
MSFRSLALGLSFLAGLATVSGCVAAPDESGDGPLGLAAERIKGGYPDPGDTSVVDMVWFEAGAFSECSGSLIAPNLVLTARHCVAEIINGAQGIDCSVAKFATHDVPGNFFISTKQFLAMDQATFMKDFRAVSEVITPTPTGVCGNDVALLVLAANMDPAEAVPLVPRVDTDIAKKDLYSAIGFGGTVQDGTNAGQRRRLDKLLVNCVRDLCPPEDFQFLAAKTEWLGDHGICEGDSGGPAIDAQNRVIGVTSRGGAGCIQPIYGSVFGQGEWIKTNALHAAQVGGYAAPAWATGFPTDPQYNFPIGDACGDPPACASGLCIGDSAGSYCTRACTDNAPCGDGYDCVDVQGTKLCQRPPPVVTSSSSSSSGSTSSGTPMTKSGCSAQGTDPTKPVPWRTGAAVAAAGLALLRRRRRGTTVAR